MYLLHTKTNKSCEKNGWKIMYMFCTWKKQKQKQRNIKFTCEPWNVFWLYVLKVTILYYTMLWVKMYINMSLKWGDTFLIKGQTNTCRISISKFPQMNSAAGPCNHKVWLLLHYGLLRNTRKIILCDIRQQDRCWTNISSPCLSSLSTERCQCSGGLDSVWLPHAAEKSVPPSWVTPQPATQRLHHLLPHSWCAGRHAVHLVAGCSGVTWGKRYIILMLIWRLGFSHTFLHWKQIQKQLTSKMSTVADFLHHRVNRLLLHYLGTC